MSINGFDAEILGDFLTESGELLDRLESRLVDLEATPSDPELLNEVFRALHTIKGSASFLALTNLIEIAHAAETALNAARKRDIVIDRIAMDYLLAAVDVLKKQLDEVRNGQMELTPASAELVANLVALGEGPGNSNGAIELNVPASVAGSETEASDGIIRMPLELCQSKQDLLLYFINDLEDSIERSQAQVTGLVEKSTRAQRFCTLSEIAEDLIPTMRFFEFEEMTALVRLMHEAAETGSSLSDEIVLALVPRLEEILRLMEAQAHGARAGIRLSHPTENLCRDIHALLAGQSSSARPANSPVNLACASAQEVSPVPAVLGSTSENGTSPTQESWTNQTRQRRQPAMPEQTIRVEVGRLETLMNLVGELVLQKNRITSISNDVAGTEVVTPELSDAMTMASDTLARITSDMQVAVMRTRMQPLKKLFNKYPRLIRDLATTTGKEISLVIEGGETEVDKSILEELGDPLVHLMRNCADHGLEEPDERLQAGKERTGMIRLCAAHRGNHVEIKIIDNGRGLSRERLAAKAIEKSLASESEIASMSDEEVYQFVFHPGFSTASTINALSGRGVGMDVVRTNIQKLKGTVEVSSVFGAGTTITILIPLTVAIMPAMMVGIADEVYAIPLGNIVEILHPEPTQLLTVLGARVLRVRHEVLPAVDAMEVFGVPVHARSNTPMAIILRSGSRVFSLLVTRVIGQQEVVIKSLDACDAVGPVCGATVRNDGGVSLIIDVAELIEKSSHHFRSESHEGLAAV